MSKQFVGGAEFASDDTVDELSEGGATPLPPYDPLAHTLAVTRFVEAEQDYELATRMYPDGHPERLGAESLFGLAQVALALASIKAPLEGDPALEPLAASGRPSPAAKFRR